MASASWIDWPMRIAGAAILVVLGVRAWMDARRDRAGVGDGVGGGGGGGVARAFGTTFVLTITNPATILSFAAVAASLGVGRGSVAGAFVLAASVFLGSAAWWLILSTAAAALRHRIGARARRFIHGASGVILIAFAIAAAIRLVT